MQKNKNFCQIFSIMILHKNNSNTFSDNECDHKFRLYSFHVDCFQIFYLILRFLWIVKLCLCSLFVSDLAVKNSVNAENLNKNDMRSRSAENMWSNRFFDDFSLRFKNLFSFDCCWRRKKVFRFTDDEIVSWYINCHSFKDFV